MESKWEFTHHDITVFFQEQCLTIANHNLSRKIDFSTGAPHTVSLCYGNEELVATQDCFDCEIAGLPLPTPGKHEKLAEFGLQLTGAEARLATPREGEAVVVEVASFEALRQITRINRYYIYRELPVIAMELEFVSSVNPQCFFSPRHCEQFNRECGFGEPLTIVDRIRFATMPEIDCSVEFKLRTDYSNELICRHTRPHNHGYTGNLLLGKLPGHAFFYLQEAPPSNERRDLESFDFKLPDAQSIISSGSGIHPAEIRPGVQLKSYRHILGITAPGQAELIMKRYEAARLNLQRRNYCNITVNPWGSGHFPERNSEAFLSDEIMAAAQLNAEVYQIDDGYQAGAGLGEMIVKNRPIDRNFWSIDYARFPRGLDPLCELAQQQQLALSLWFAPSSNIEFRNWEESAELLLEFHRRYRINGFKLDGVEFTSYTAEINFKKLLTRLEEASNGTIMTNLDVTNGLRGGLLYLMEFGNVFLENRYVCHEWPLVLYHPIDTLRNLWKLSHYIRPQNLQIEIPSPDDLNSKAYEQFGRPALPTQYDFEFWVGVALFANPLLWFQPSRQSAAVCNTVKRLMLLHREWRPELFAQEIEPIGNEPGSGKLSGFCSENGFVIVYRELGAPKMERIVPLHHRAQLLYATHPAILTPDGTAELTEPGSFAVWHLER